MFLYVYVLRGRTSRLSAVNILAQPPAFGRLVLRDTDGMVMASLYDNEAKDVLPPLIHAQVKRINMGMHLVGIEQEGRAAAKAKITRFRQAWLCAADAAILEPLVRMIPAPRSSSTGFDPADDDRED